MSGKACGFKDMNIGLFIRNENGWFIGLTVFLFVKMDKNLTYTKINKLIIENFCIC